LKETTKDLTPPYGKYLIRLTRPFPNFDFSFIKPVRQEAVASLGLKPGDRVLDLGCGPGGSFPFLVKAVGPTGEVVGVELSPEISINARKRIEKNNWQNVQVIEAAAQDVELTGKFDGVIMFAAPDVYASEAAFENILPFLNEGARIAAFGGKLSNDRVGGISNPVLRMLYKLSFKTTPGPDYEPWEILAKHLDQLVVRDYFLGTMFLATGSLIRSSTSGSSQFAICV
jgi:demethylmenaquinone methyltransferase/2-methoxy-6-polyprenyl-1,4-benzoquinol methylase